MVCSNIITREKQIIEVEELQENGVDYKHYKVISATKNVKTIKRILKTASWETNTTEMNRPADYRFIFQYENDKYEAKAILYQVWIPSDGKQITIMRETSQYAVLSVEDSTKLSKLLFE